MYVDGGTAQHLHVIVHRARYYMTELAVSVGYNRSEHMMK